MIRGRSFACLASRRPLTGRPPRTLTPPVVLASPRQLVRRLVHEPHLSQAVKTEILRRQDVSDWTAADLSCLMRPGSLVDEALLEFVEKTVEKTSEAALLDARISDLLLLARTLRRSGSAKEKLARVLTRHHHLLDEEELAILRASSPSFS